MEASKENQRPPCLRNRFGCSKRVVVWDTTIQKLTTNETLFIFGHEAGHYVLNHVRNGFPIFGGRPKTRRLLPRLSRPEIGLSACGSDWKIYGPRIGRRWPSSFFSTGDRVLVHADREGF